MKALDFKEDYRRLNTEHDGQEFGEETALHYHNCFACGEAFECEADDEQDEETLCDDCIEEGIDGIED